ncbi:TLC domain-containing protein At5g14285-like [Lycium barbarum]|uniref:TLC domain-containing protein At5g14285-like n=1 Tax=Lycium barbarum TaxID=112863 RepID=UPI00293F0B91|nr:TLC domain-containing protein At5g14285-like [Lycium barbarum]
METLTILEPNLLGFSLFFFVIYLFGYFYIFKDWNEKVRSDASSCVMSLAHGTPAVILSIYSMLQNSQTSFQNLDFSTQNSPLQETILEYSIAYFLADLLHYFVFYPSDVLFIAHHLATLYVFLTCRFVVHHGAATLIGLLVIAEITSPCQNTWSLSRYRKIDTPVAAKLYEKLSPIFYLFYSLVRGILGPLFVYKMGLAFASGKADGVISRPMWISWMIVIVSAILVSILWVVSLWVDFFRERPKKQLKKCN